MNLYGLVKVLQVSVQQTPLNDKQNCRSNIQRCLLQRVSRYYCYQGYSESMGMDTLLTCVLQNAIFPSGVFIRQNMIPLPTNISPSLTSYRLPFTLNSCVCADTMGCRENTHSPLPMIPLRNCERGSGHVKTHPIHINRATDYLVAWLGLSKAGQL